MTLNIAKIEEIAQKHTKDFSIIEDFEQFTLMLPKERIQGVAQDLRDSEELKFDMLTDVTAIDRLTKKARFELVYFLYSNSNKSRLRLKTIIEENDAFAPTLTGIWDSANWYERETYDMYGIKFEGHPDMRRFYMPEDFNDPSSGEPLYPLRKDFPMMGVKDALPLPQFPEKVN